MNNLVFRPCLFEVVSDKISLDIKDPIHPGIFTISPEKPVSGIYLTSVIVITHLYYVLDNYVRGLPKKLII